MRSSPRWIQTLPLLTLALAGCAQESQVGQQTQGIFGGVNDTIHTNVVGIVIQSGGGLGTCTGSLIARNLVLTARHCVSEISGEAIVCSRFTQDGMTYEPSTAAAPYNPGGLLVTTDSVITQSSRFVRVAEVMIPPDSTGVPMCGKDIALLRLSSYITEVPLIRPRLDVASFINEAFTASGYGAINGRGGGSGTRRMRAGLAVEHVGLAQARPGLTVVAAEEFLANTGTCQGDSGGPALDELNEVFGILSRGSATSCDSPIYTRVDSYAAWIRAQAQRSAMIGSYAAPDWVTPPVAAEGAIGDLCQSDIQCAAPSRCLPIGGGVRGCTTNDCTACPENFVCNDTSTHCVRDPSTIPPPAPDAGPEAGPAPDAGMTGPDGGVTTPMMTGGCSVHGTGPGTLAPLVAALAMLASRRRARRVS
ncbi:MAG: trypsin-like serine protease [Deltaproteobacteria bacterium]|nr:trypsin-like serine protease [Deltaproteobacteria bacterium]